MTKLLPVALLIAVCVPGSASAATAAVETTYCEGDACRYCGQWCETSRLFLRAAPGEANRVTVRSSADGVTFIDHGAPLRAGAGCTQVDANTVTCAAASGPWIELGDGDDQLIASDAAEVIDGGPGADRLQTGGGDDRIEDSDDSEDVIDGGAGTDEVSYSGRRRGIEVEVGRLIGIERVVGGYGDDVLRGGTGAEELYGGAGSDRLLGAGGDDFLAGGAGPDVYRCGAGRDEVSEPEATELIPRDCERVGSGDAVTVDPHPRVSRDGRTLRFRVACDADEYARSCPFRVSVSRGSWRVTARRRVPRGRSVVMRVRLPRPVRVAGVSIDNGVLSLDVDYRVGLR